MMTLETGKQKDRRSPINVGLIQLSQPPRHPKQSRRRNSRTPSPNSPLSSPVSNSSLSPSNQLKSISSIANNLNGSNKCSLLDITQNSPVDNLGSRGSPTAGCPVLSFKENYKFSSNTFTSQSQNISTSNNFNKSFQAINPKASLNSDEKPIFNIKIDQIDDLVKDSNNSDSVSPKPIEKKIAEKFSDDSDFLAFSEFNFKVKEVPTPKKSDTKTSPLSDNQVIPLLPPPPESRGKSPSRSSQEKKNLLDLSGENDAPKSNNENSQSGVSFTSSNTNFSTKNFLFGDTLSSPIKPTYTTAIISAEKKPTNSAKSATNKSKFDRIFSPVEKLNFSSKRHEFRDPFSPLSEKDISKKAKALRKGSLDFSSSFAFKNLGSSGFSSPSSKFASSYLKSTFKPTFSSQSSVSPSKLGGNIPATASSFKCLTSSSFKTLDISTASISLPNKVDVEPSDSPKTCDSYFDSENSADSPLLTSPPLKNTITEFSFDILKNSNFPANTSPTSKTFDARKASVSSFKTLGSPSSSTSSFEAFESPASSLIPYKPFDFPPNSTSLPTAESPVTSSSFYDAFDSPGSSSSSRKFEFTTATSTPIKTIDSSGSTNKSNEISGEDSTTTKSYKKLTSNAHHKRFSSSTNFFDFSSMSSELNEYEVEDENSFNSSSSISKERSDSVFKYNYAKINDQNSSPKGASYYSAPVESSVAVSTTTITSISTSDPVSKNGSASIFTSQISASMSVKNRQARMSLTGLSVPHLMTSEEYANVKHNNTPYTPLTTPDFKIDLLESDGRRPSMAGRFTPPLPNSFPFITAEDLTPEELHAFDMKWGSPHHARGRRGIMRPTLLALPANRPRMTSLPNRKEDREEEEDEYYRLRHFSITGRGVINRGDSFKSRRSKSNNSVASDVSRRLSIFDGRRSLTPPWIATPLITLSCEDVTRFNEGWAWSHPCSLGTSAASSAASSRASSASESSFPFRVVMLGASGVGKTTLCHQFMTSEHINAYDSSLDDEYGEKSVSIMLDEEESEIELIDHPADEMSVENYLATYNPHAIVVVFSVTDRPSFVRAEETVQYLWRLNVMSNKGVILVGNKTDLVRNRCVTFKESSNLADSYDCKFIETSSGLNHQVDELLVGIVKQIRLKLNNPEVSKEVFRKRSSRKRKFRGTKTSASLKVKSLLTKVCGKELKSKSCENLHVL